MSPASSADEREPSTLAVLGVVWAIALAGAGAAVVAFFAAFRYIATHHLGVLSQVAATLLFGVAVLVIALGAASAGRRMSKGARPLSTAMRRYQRRFFIAQVLYILSLTTSIFGYQLLPHGSPLLWLAALAPAVPVVALIAIMGLYLREETDEFQRAVQTEAALWATGGMLALTTVWGFLEQFDLVPHVMSWAAFVVWAMLLGPAQVIARRRYR